MTELDLTDEDLLYEEELLRNPFTLRLWIRYLDARKSVTPKRRYLLFERACRALPGSYKLWYAYLKERQEAIRGTCIDHSSYEALNNCYERALVTMHKMPRIWEMYLKHLNSQKHFTRMRHTCDRALRSLPITQHERMWTIYLDFVRSDGIPTDTALRVYRRYLQLEPTHAEEYIEYLKKAGHWNEAAVKLAELVNDDSFQSLAGKTKHQLWLELCDIITKHPADVTSLQVDPILRGGIRKFTDEVGRLWTSLADYYIRKAIFEKARDVYEEGMTTVTTVRDFSVIFDAFMQFEESMLSARMEALGDAADEDEEELDPDDNGEDFLLKDDGNDIDLRLARLEYHMERRPELVSSVMLRQNPHNVFEWHKRVKLFEGKPTKQIFTFTEAVKTVDPEVAVGKPHTLWVAFAKFYETHQDLGNARIILEKAVQVNYKAVDDLATVWCEWAEMELRHQNFQSALDLMRRATKHRPGRVKEDGPVQSRLHKSLKLWMFYCDLEESLGDLDSAKAVYEKILDIRIATPQIILNYALLLWESKHFEDAFQVLGHLHLREGAAARINAICTFERAFQVPGHLHFRGPARMPRAWLDAAHTGVHPWQHGCRTHGWMQLTPVSTLGSTDAARTAGCSSHRCPPLAARMPHDGWMQLTPVSTLGSTGCRTHGWMAQSVFTLAARMPHDGWMQLTSVHPRHGCRTHGWMQLTPDEKLAMYELYLNRAKEFFGVGKAREILETAIDAKLPDSITKSLCVQYANLERRLGEIDRARALFRHASQFADPKTDYGFWDEWNEFEIKHGNEDTFREMLRIKRSVSASYSQTHFNMATAHPTEATGAEPPSGDAGIAAAGAVDPMAALDQQAVGGTNLAGFVSGGVEGQQVASQEAKNEEEIDLGDDDDDDEDDDGEEKTDAIEEQQVPDAVFGELKKKAEDEAADASAQPSAKKRKT
ncbi:hypothetical protein CYMTET_5767 [Cymbomonas tetramitiformis]|uniref:Pre-mRNA-splicing factor SYF1 n=1 Tax=Cymbomonas tetramitiformis TaxID=36881 RepID=A0AAE0GYH9_9CHLO|nr:hypothetical protein CYMTET_5767 [Cymbomonas tetramitiformis]